MHHDSFGWIAIRNGMSDAAFNYHYRILHLRTVDCKLLVYDKKIPCEVAPFLLVIGYGGRFSYF